MLTLLAVFAAACGSSESTNDRRNDVETEVTNTAFVEGACSGTFVAHDLAHVTAAATNTGATLDGTGAGVLVDDIDGDGWPDIVLPNLSGQSSIFWNQGALEFDRHDLVRGRFRQIVTADVDGDGHRDLVLTTGVSEPVLLHNDGGSGRSFTRTELTGVRSLAYSVAPGDLDGDGGIDLATGSYNAELTSTRDTRAMLGVDVGTAVHRRTATGWVTEELTANAQALVTLIVDLDGDQRSDVVAGNDLSTPDKVWLGTDAGLTLTELFDTTTLSTMSMDVGDVDNDGDFDLVATDMKPMDDDPETLEAWQPVFDDIEAVMIDEVQIPANVLQLRDGDRFAETATSAGVDATGWSWSGLLGDLDQDGLLDLHVVNGMRAVGIFAALPNAELVEPNQVFRQVTAGFEPRPDWGLGDTAGGRGSAQADLDGDGDLDLVVNNLDGPARIFENQLCSGGSVVVELHWSDVANLDALGATVDVTADGVTHRRQITGARGYLSTSQTIAHVGLGPDAQPVTISVTWPDGGHTTLDDVSPGRVEITRTTPPQNEEA